MFHVDFTLSSVYSCSTQFWSDNYANLKKFLSKDFLAYWDMKIFITAMID